MISTERLEELVEHNQADLRMLHRRRSDLVSRIAKIDDKITETSRELAKHRAVLENVIGLNKEDEENERIN